MRAAYDRAVASTQVLAEYGLDGMPVAVALGALFGIVMARSHLTYWAGRGVQRAAAYEGSQAHGPRWWRRTVDRAARVGATPSARYGVALVHRWGPLAVTLAYATVGLQTAVFLGAGVVRMPYLRFTLASLPGAAIWVLIWGTVGMSAVWGAVALAAGSPWGFAVLALTAAVVGALVAAAVRRRRRPEPHLPTTPRTAPDDLTAAPEHR